jgi:glutathione S-transferase
MELVLHLLPPSHPCKTVEAALARKELPYERVVLRSGEHNDEMERIYGPAGGRSPGSLVDGEPVHGSPAILARLEELAPEPPLFPAPIADRVREAEAWGDRELQDLGRHLSWGRCTSARSTWARSAARASSIPPARTSPSASCARLEVPRDQRRAPGGRPRRPAREDRSRGRARRGRHRGGRSRRRPTCSSGPPCACS